PQGFAADDVSDLETEVLEHLLARVLETGLSLEAGGARVIDAAAQRGGSAAIESIDHDHTGSRFTGLECGASARRAEPHDHYVGRFVPRDAVRIVDLQRGQNHRDLRNDNDPVTAARTPSGPATRSRCRERK